MNLGNHSEFNTVRVLCHACGWFRNIGYTGIKNNTRAVIKIRASKDPSHLLEGTVLEFPANKPLAEVAATHPDFQDLEAEALKHGLSKAMAKFAPMLEGAICPRCKKGGQLCLSSIIMLGREIKY